MKVLSGVEVEGETQHEHRMDFSRPVVLHPRCILKVYNRRVRYDILGVHGIHGSINTRRTDAYRCDTYQEDVHERLESCSCPRTQATCSITILTICTLHDHDQRANTDCSTLAYFVSVHIKAVHPSHPNR